MNGKVARKKPEQTAITKPQTNGKGVGGMIPGLSELNNPLDSLAQLSPDGLQDMQQTYGNGFLQRLISGQTEVNRAPDGEAGSLVSDDVERGIDESRGGGSTMPDAFRKRMEGHFNADFSQTRIHTNDKADTLSRSLGARSFTSGSDIFFKEGEYDPNSQDGQKLLAHELTHVTQQGGARSSRAQAKMSVNEPGDVYEQEADAAAEAAVNAPAPTEGVETPTPPTEEGAPASGDLAVPSADGLKGQGDVDMGQVKAIGNQAAKEAQSEIGAPPTTAEPVQTGEEQSEGGSAESDPQATADSTPPDEGKTDEQQKAKSDEGGTQEEAKKEDDEKKEEDGKKEKGAAAPVPKVKKEDPSKVEEMKFDPESVEEPEPAPLLPSWNELAYGTVQRVSDTVPAAVESYDSLVGSSGPDASVVGPAKEADNTVLETEPEQQDVDREALIGQSLLAGALSGAAQGASEFITDQLIEEAMTNLPVVKKIPYADGLMTAAQIAADPEGWAKGVKSAFGKEGFNTMASGFTAIGDESTWAGYIAATLEAIMGVIDWINNMLGIVTQVLQILLFVLTSIATALAATGFLAAVVSVLLNIIAFLEKILNFISAIVTFLLHLKPTLQILAIFFRAIDIKIFEGDPQELMEKQAKLTGLVTGYVKGATTRAMNKGWAKTKAGISNKIRKKKAAKIAEHDDNYFANKPKSRDDLKDEYKEKYGSDPEADAKRDKGEALDLTHRQKDLQVAQDKANKITQDRQAETQAINQKQNSISKREKRRGKMDEVTREPTADYNKRLTTATDAVNTATTKRNAQQTIDNETQNIATQEDNIRTYDRNIYDAKQDIADTELRLERKDQEITATQGRIRDIDDDIRQKQEIAATGRQAQNERATLNKQKRVEEQELEKLQTYERDLNNQIKEQKQRVKNLEDQRSLAEKSKQESIDQAKQASEQLEKQKSVDKVKEVEEAKKVESLKSQDDPETMLKNANENIERQSKEIEQYDKQIENAEKQREFAESGLKRVGEDIEKTNEDLQKTNQAIDQNQQKIIAGQQATQNIGTLNQRKQVQQNQLLQQQNAKANLQNQKTGYEQAKTTAKQNKQQAQQSIQNSETQKAQAATALTEDKKKGVWHDVGDVAVTGVVGEARAKGKALVDSAKEFKSPLKHGSLEEMQKGWAGQRHSGGITGQTVGNATLIASLITGKDFNPQEELGKLISSAIVPTDVAAWSQKYGLNTVSVNTGLPDLGTHNTDEGEVTWIYEGSSDFDDVSDPPTTAKLTRNGDDTTKVKQFGTYVKPSYANDTYTTEVGDSPIIMIKSVSTESGKSDWLVTFSAPTVKNSSRDSDNNFIIDIEYDVEETPAISNNDTVAQTKRDESASRQRSSGLVVQRKEDEEVRMPMPPVPASSPTIVQRQVDEEEPIGEKPQPEEETDSASKQDDLTDTLTDFAAEIGSQDSLDEDPFDAGADVDLEEDEEGGGAIGGAQSRMNEIRRAKIAEMIDEMEEPPQSAIDQVNAAAAAYEVQAAEEEVAIARQQELEGTLVDMQSQEMELEAAETMGVANQQALATHQADIDEKLVAQDEQEALSKDAGKAAEEGASSSNPIEALMQMIMTPLTKVLTGVVSEFTDMDTGAGQQSMQESGKAAGAPSQGTDTGKAGAQAGVAEANQRKSDTLKAKGEAKKSEQELAAYNEAMASGRDGAQEGQEELAMLGEQNQENIESLSEDKEMLVDAHQEGQDDAEAWADEHFAMRDEMFAELEMELELAIEEESQR